MGKLSRASSFCSFGKMLVQICDMGTMEIKCYYFGFILLRLTIFGAVRVVQSVVIHMYTTSTKWSFSVLRKTVWTSNSWEYLQKCIWPMVLVSDSGVCVGVSCTWNSHGILSTENGIVIIWAKSMLYSNTKETFKFQNMISPLCTKYRLQISMKHVFYTHFTKLQLTSVSFGNKTSWE